MLFSQHASTDLQTHLLLQEATSRETVRLFIKGDIENLRNDWSQYEAVQRLHSGNIASIEIPKDRVAELLFDPRIETIEYPNAPGVLLNDRMVVNNNIWQVHEGLGVLPQAYTGKGVVIGFLDTGIEINHPDFKNADGTSRIKWIWDQNLPNGPNTPADYGFGQEWNDIGIDQGLCTHVDPVSLAGHGSNVAGIGAGNGLAMNHMEGVATEADIIMVAVKLTTGFMSNVADGIDYVFKKADQLGKPCVINTSLGTYSGSHDAKDATAQFIESLLDAKPGRALVAAAGNAGDIPFHLGYDVTSDTNFTWFQYYAASGRVVFEFWADEAELNNVRFAIGAYNNADKTDRGRTAFINVISTLGLDVSTSNTYNETVMFGPDQIGQVTVFGSRNQGRYQIQVQVLTTYTGYYWALMMTGSGRFDGWNGNSTTGTSNMVNSGLPTAAEYPKIIRYELPDLNQTIVGSWACSDKVITVANYVNRTQYINFNGTITTLAGQTTLDIAPLSSTGPSRTGLLKPDVTASGNTILSAGPIGLLNGYKGTNPELLAPGGFHKRNGGTSMAAPVVSGIAALILERYPTFTYAQVNDAIVNTCYGDGYTGTLPNTRWGHGRVHAYNALAVEVGCTDPLAVNFNPFAQVDDGNCSYLQPVAGMDDVEGGRLVIQPNPASRFAEVFYSGSDATADLTLTDLAGRVVMKVGLPSSEGARRIDLDLLDSGIYFVRVDNGSRHAIEKLVVAR